MILKKKEDILNWLKNNDYEYMKNIQKNAYEFIDVQDMMNQSLLNETIKKDNLSLNFFENLKSEGHHYIVNVKGNLDISRKELNKISIQFYHINGYFYCGNNDLKSLKGCPKIVNGHFSCSYNQLTSLKYCPQKIGGNFSCDNNQLTSLEYCPQVIEGYFYCNNNHLTSLEYCPKHISGHFYCPHNQLTSLEYCPQSISGHFYCFHNQLTSLEYFPEIVTKGVYLYLNTQLLKYKNQSNDPNIPNMSDDEFLNQRNFSFWQQFHLMEKIKKENNQIIENLYLNDKKENLTSNQQKVKKV